MILCEEEAERLRVSLESLLGGSLLTQPGGADFYSVLGVTRDSDEEEIKKAYRKRARQCHPDKNVNNNNNADPEEVRRAPDSTILCSASCKSDAHLQIKRVIEAKEVLMDPETRNFYDM